MNKSCYEYYMEKLEYGKLNKDDYEQMEKDKMKELTREKLKPVFDKFKADKKLWKKCRNSKSYFKKYLAMLWEIGNMGVGKV